MFSPQNPNDLHFEQIRYEKDGPRATVAIPRPHVHNALAFKTLREMRRAFEDAA
ncbi:MAG: hypothetical protein HY660_15040 [Armatimonadetes bacterium]|nr:hypothetical protein [Armatimonadota bacterium]